MNAKIYHNCGIQIGIGGIDCPCCSAPRKFVKKMANRAFRRTENKEIEES